MVIIVTGAIGIGKTTVCEKVIKITKSLGCTCGGILTYKTVDKLIVVDIQTEEREALASINNIYKGPHVGKYFFNPEGIEFGIRAIDRGSSSDILFGDEIGYLELRGGGFVEILELIKAEKVKDSILVIRKELLSDFSARLGSRPLILETTSNNRNELPEKICLLLSRSFKKQDKILKGDG
jgi:nucleoside-triphosphatase THEP1